MDVRRWDQLQLHLVQNLIVYILFNIMETFRYCLFQVGLRFKILGQILVYF